MRIFALISALFVSLAFGRQALAAGASKPVPRDFVPARGLAMGGGRMAASGAEAIFLNPAALGGRRQYSLQLDYGTSSGQGVQTNGDALVLSIVDSVSNPNFPSGLAYRWVSIGEGASATTGSTKDMSVAMPFSDAFAIGMHVTWLSYTQDKREISQITGDFGGLMAFGPLKLGVVGYNLIAVDSPDAARGLATGLALTDEYSYRLSADVRWDWLKTNTPRSYSMGAEYILFDLLPLRAGYDWDGVRQTEFVSGGSGFQTAQFGCDVSYRLDRKTDTGYWGFAVRILGA